MALPVIRAIRKGRPDARKSHFYVNHPVELLKVLCLADKVHALPQTNGVTYFNDVRKLNIGPCDAMLVLTNSWRGDLESILLSADVRLGAEIKGRRHLLNSPSCP